MAPTTTRRQMSHTLPSFRHVYRGDGASCHTLYQASDMSTEERRHHVTHSTKLQTCLSRGGDIMSPTLPSFRHVYRGEGIMSHTLPSIRHVYRGEGGIMSHTLPSFRHVYRGEGSSCHTLYQASDMSIEGRGHHVTHSTKLQTCLPRVGHHVTHSTKLRHVYRGEGIMSHTLPSFRHVYRGEGASCHTLCQASDMSIEERGASCHTLCQASDMSTEERGHHVIHSTKLQMCTLRTCPPRGGGTSFHKLCQASDMSTRWDASCYPH